MAHQVLAAPTPGAVPELGGPQPPAASAISPSPSPSLFPESESAPGGSPTAEVSPDRNCWPAATKGAHISYQILYMRWCRDVRNCHQKRHENKSKVGVTIFEDASRVWLGSKLFGARTLAWSQWAALVFVIRHYVIPLAGLWLTYNVQPTAVPRSCRSRLSESPASLTSRSQPHHRGYQPDLQLDHRISF